MALINRWSKAMAELVKSSFEVSSSIANHGTVLGDARESFIRDILEKFLPSNVVIGSGQIIDSNDRLSKQIDIIIYRNDFPVLRTLGTSDVYLIEGVIASIEVKSSLNSKSLVEALENCKSVRDLKPTFIRESMNHYTNPIYDEDFEVLSDDKKNSVMGLILPPTYIFSYQGFTDKSLASFIESLNSWYIDPEGGEYDLTVMPEAIISSGCVALKNLNDTFGLGAVPDDLFLRDLRQSLLNNSNFKSTLSAREIKILLDIDPNFEFNFGMVAKVDVQPIQYLICNLLETLCSRQGVQQFGSTPVAYSLLAYSEAPESHRGWVGTAINLNRITCPKLDHYRNIFA